MCVNRSRCFLLLWEESEVISDLTPEDDTIRDARGSRYSQEDRQKDDKESARYPLRIAVRSVWESIKGYMNEHGSTHCNWLGCIPA